MPIRPTRRDQETWEDLVPLGGLGLDYETNTATARAEALVVGENLRLDAGVVARKKGAIKVYRSPYIGGSRTFGATTIYATVPAAAQLQLAEGGFALRFSFTAVRPGGGNTAYILSSRVNSQSYHVLYATLSDAGVLTVGWTKDSDASDVSVASTALAAGATAHVLAVFDAVSGTFTLYIDGASDGTPVTGISVTEKPKAGSGTAWHFGVHYNPAVAGVVANTNFDGKLDAVTLMSLRGKRVADGTPTLLSVLLKHSFRVWPTPQMDMVLFQYDMSGAATSLPDRSRHKNDCTLTGTHTATAAVALASNPTNYVGTHEYASGRKVNVISNYGRLLYEDVRGDT